MNNNSVQVMEKNLVKRSRLISSYCMNLYFL